ncbi:MAG: hypothetical protein LBI48_12120 [Burkholderiaceae bacterium]|jgi:hypothetical protein|nr:hypothetical protein [Burkholderiaceae bacterium]
MTKSFKPRGAAICAALGVLVLAAAAPQYAQAQGQVIANNVSITASGAVNTGTAASTTGYALYALNGGAITSTGALALTTGGSTAYGAAALSGGQITIHGGYGTSSAVTTGGYMASGLFAEGTGSKIFVTDTDITTNYSAGTVYAVQPRMNGTIELTGGSVKMPYATGGTALYAFSGGAAYTATIKATDVQVSAGGSRSYGAQANLNGSIELLRGSVTTAGNNGYGLYTIGDGAFLTAAGAKVSTGGVDAAGVYVQQGSMKLADVDIDTTGMGGKGAMVDNASSLTLTRGSVTTHGSNTSDTAPGLLALSASVLTAKDTAITTYGDGSYGAASQFGSQVLLTGGSVATRGASALGLFSVGLAGTTGASLTADGVTVETTGANSHGAAVLGGSSLTIQNGGSVTAEGAGAAALYASPYDTNPSTATVANSTLTSGQYAGILAVATTLNATLTHSSLNGAPAWWAADSTVSSVPTGSILPDMYIPQIEVKEAACGLKRLLFFCAAYPNPNPPPQAGEGI